MDYTELVPGPGNGCPRCHELWSKADNKALGDHIYEHLPREKKRFAFTLTTNGDDKIKEQRALCCAVHKLFLQKTVPIEAGEAYLEYTEEGRPHVHGWYQTESGGRVFAKMFARCWPLWKEKRGQTRFGGGYHEELKSDRYLAYASAEDRQIIKKIKNEELLYNANMEQVCEIE